MWATLRWAGIVMAVSLDALFTQALGLCAPWKVISTQFDPERKLLELVIDFKPGSRFIDPQSGEPCSVHDTVQRSWQHLNFFEHTTTIKARVPRVKTSDGKVKTVEVPWAKPHSGFTLLMECHLLLLARALPVTEVSAQTGVSQDRIWHLIRKRVKDAWEQADWSSLRRLGVDETSTKKGHKYGTAFMEIEGQIDSSGLGAAKVSRLLFFTPGKGKETFSAFTEELQSRQFDLSQIEEVAMDLSPAFISAAALHFPEATVVFDRFHVMKLCGKACDDVRKQVSREAGGLGKGALWALRGNVENRTAKQRELREELCQRYEKIGRAMALRDFLSDLWNFTNRDEAAEHLKAVRSWMSRSRLAPFVNLSRTLKRHTKGILGYYKNYTTSAAIEAVNNVLQLARRRARGYRCFENFRAIAYWIAGGLSIHPELDSTH